MSKTCELCAQPITSTQDYIVMFHWEETTKYVHLECYKELEKE